MIIESLIIGFTTIVVSSIIFANSLIKKQRQWDAEDDTPDPIIHPFIEIAIGTPCIKCGEKGRNCVKKEFKNGTSIILEAAAGPALAKSCTNTKCPAAIKHISHLHVHCNSCQSIWMMRTADYKEEDNV